MFNIPKKVIDRATASLKNYQKIAESHRARDVSEADTVTLIKDILADVCGFDKYTELTSEQQIRGTFCDLAIRIDGKIRVLLEAKAAGVDLNESHLRQAINYAANQGIEWVMLTNSIRWRLFRMKFAQPIDAEEICSFDLTTLNPRAEDDQRKLFMISREGVLADAMNLFHQHAAIMNPYTVTQVLMQDPVVAVLRRELRRIFPDIKVTAEELGIMLKSSILKREVTEGEKAADAASRVKKQANKLAKKAAKDKAPDAPGEVTTETGEQMGTDEAGTSDPDPAP